MAKTGARSSRGVARSTPPRRRGQPETPRHGSAADAVLDALRAILRAVRISATEVQRQLGLSAAQLFVLERLDQAPARSLSELARRTMTDRSAVSLVVTRLVEGGLAERVRAPEDRRRAVLTLTPRARVLLRRRSTAAPGMELTGALRRLPASQLRRLAADLGTLITALGMDDRTTRDAGARREAVQ